MRRPLTLLLAGSVIGATFTPRPAAAQSFDAPAERVVMLKDGTVLRGPIVEEVPRDHVIIVVQGLRTRVAWKDMVHPEDGERRSSRSASPVASTVALVFGSVGLLAVTTGATWLIASIGPGPEREKGRLYGGVTIGGGVVALLVAGAIGLADGIVTR